MEEVQFFKDKLQEALNVPFNRMNPDAVFAMGPGAAEISRDEIKFGKFINRLRIRFNTLFLQVLEKQLVLKGIINPQDWPTMSYYIRFRYARDNIFSELKDGEIMSARLNRAMQMVPFLGRYYSNHYLQTKVLMQTEDDIAEEMERIMQESLMPIYQQPILPVGELPPEQQGGPPQGGPPQGGGEPQK